LLQLANYNSKKMLALAILNFGFVILVDIHVVH
jgi:hypothetical protein